MYICLDLEKGTYRKLQGFGQNQAKTRHVSFPRARQLFRCNRSHPIVETVGKNEGGDEKKATFALLVFILASLEKNFLKQGFLLRARFREYMYVCSHSSVCHITQLVK